MFGRKVLQTRLGVRPTGSGKMRRFFFFSPPLGKSLNIVETIEGLSLVDTSFAPRDSAKPVFFFFLPCHPLPLLMRVTMIPNIHSLTRYCQRYSWAREFVFCYLNQPVGKYIHI